MKNIKIYKSYAEIEPEYKWDLDDILENKPLSSLTDEYFSLFDKLIEIKDSKYENIENYCAYLELAKKFNILSNKITNYLSNSLNTNLIDPKMNKISDEFEQKNQEYEIKLGSEINRISLHKDKILSWLNDVRLSEIKKDLEAILEKIEHKLSDDVEKYLNDTMTSEPSIEDFFNTLTNSELDFKYATSKNGKKYKITESSRHILLKNKDENVRKSTYINYANAFLVHKHSLTKFLYSHFKRLSTQALYRKYPSTIEMFLSEDHVNENLLKTLYNSISNNMNIFGKYIKARKMFFNKKFHKKMEKWDTSLDLVNVKNTYTINEMKEIVNNALSLMPKHYINKIKEAINNKWVDYMECPNKMSGAYSIGESYGVNKKYVLMNFDGTLNSIQTLAHELGHSMHSYYSCANNNVFRSEYPLILAEIASIFNEILLTNYLIKIAKSDEEKFYLLEQSIQNFYGTVIKQAEWSNYEFDLYNNIDKNVTYSSFEELEALFFENSKKYSVKKQKHLKNNLANIYAIIVPHYYYGFYVYKYALGYVIANAFYARIREENFNGKEIDNYINNFLSAGDRNWPADTLKNCGIDIYDSQIYKEAFQILDNQINEYIKLGKQIFKIKK